MHACIEHVDAQLDHVAGVGQLDSYDGNRMRLLLTPEIRELATAAIEAEIRQALERKLGVSLRLEPGPRAPAPPQVLVELRERGRLDRLPGARAAGRGHVRARALQRGRNNFV